MLSAGRTFGTKLPDGSWTGLMGMVVREVSKAPVVLKQSIGSPYTKNSRACLLCLMTSAASRQNSCDCCFQEVDLCVVPVALSPVRAEAVEYTLPLWTGRLNIVGGLGRLKVNPWGFLLPLTHLVWVATLMALLEVLAVQYLFSLCLPGRVLGRDSWQANTFSFVRVILQQGNTSGTVPSSSLVAVALRLEVFLSLRKQQSCPNED